METVSFDKVFQYSTLKTGITVLVILGYNGMTVDLEAKIDTGATDCIFERKHAERLGIDVESGEFVRFSTAVGNLTPTRTNLGYQFWKSKLFRESILLRKNHLHEMC